MINFISNKEFVRNSQVDQLNDVDTLRILKFEKKKN